MRRRLQRALEAGTFSGPLARLLSSAWARYARVVRPLTWPESLWMVGVGGATLGGSGKTAVALELARSAPAGLRVCVVTRAYPQRVLQPRQVLADDPVQRVGDEALMLARALAGSGVEVWVGPRQATVACIAPGGGAVILDGVLQASPRRLDCSILSIEAAEPWGAGRCPPAGDLAARPLALLASADLVLWRHGAGAGDRATEPPLLGLCGTRCPPAFVWTQRLVGARTAGGVRIALERMATLRLGLLLAVGRPGRVMGELAALGIRPSRVILRPDHGRFPPASRLGGTPLDAWLTTAKCATKLEFYYGGVPVWILEQAGGLPEPVVARGFGRASLAAPKAC